MCRVDVFLLLLPQTIKLQHFDESDSLWEGRGVRHIEKQTNKKPLKFDSWNCKDASVSAMAVSIGRLIQSVTVQVKNENPLFVKAWPVGLG